MRRKLFLLPLLAVLLAFALAAVPSHAQPTLPPDDAPQAAVLQDAPNVHRFPRPAGLAWNSTSFCYDAVQPDEAVDASGARYWLCYSRGPQGTGQYVVRTKDEASWVVDVGIVPSARGSLSVNALTGGLELVFHDANGPGWAEVPGWVPALPARVGLPLVGQAP